MRHKLGTRESGSEQMIHAIKRKTRRQYNAEEKIRIVLDGLRGEDSISELCRREQSAKTYGRFGLNQGGFWKLAKCCSPPFLPSEKMFKHSLSGKKGTSKLS